MHDPATALAEARAAFEARAWGDARARLTTIDDRGELGPDDLARLARAQFLTGRYSDAETTWSRAHQHFLEDDHPLRAVRCAFWLGFVLLQGLGAQVRGHGWLARARRLLDEVGAEECPERGLLLLPEALRALESGRPTQAHGLFRRATALGEEFGDADLTTLGRLGQGQSLIHAGDARQGIALLDEAMLDVDGDRVSTLTAGVTFCAAILACQQVLDVRRAGHWTQSLTTWCAAQPDLVPFRGECLVHRSELATLRGDWEEATARANAACASLGEPAGSAAGMAHYQRAELHRLRGEEAEAERAYQRAADHGRDPQPGLALLRRDQGRIDAAVSAIRRVLAQADTSTPSVGDETTAPRSRAELLTAAVEIMLADDDVEAARAAAEELAGLAGEFSTPLASALAARARGAVLLADGHADLALGPLTTARALWLELAAPHELARTRILLAQALRRRGDDDTADLEARAATRAFEELGATADLERVRATRSATAVAARSDLTPREVEVVRLVAAGRTNRAIARELAISDKTVARHLHNVFTKLDLPNRSAATAWAYEHGIVVGSPTDLHRPDVHRPDVHRTV